MIHIQGVTKIYASPHGDVTSLGDVDFHVAAGQFVAVLGRSGAGKSSLLAVCGGLVRPTRGRVVVAGHSLWEMSERQRARLRAVSMGFVLQTAPVLRSLTVLENVLLAEMFLPAGLARGQQRAMELLEQVGLAEKARSYPRQLSGGQQRRVAIASALMNAPTMLLADEPTGDLDVQTERQIADLFGRLHRDGMTIVVVTHNELFASLADRVLHIEAGRIIEESPISSPWKAMT
ncbi:MAG: ABC transporter ATP-binding protein [Planctomycetes bacterium]|nr:ABC transporter ATP-binding protein [Planctomycetota bacterium]